MEFCEKCGGMILLNEGKAACLSCGAKLKKKPKIESSEIVVRGDSVAVVNDEESETKPIIQMNCAKCKHKEAYFWTKQTRSSDESETKFYQCVKCKHTWRDYS